MDHVVAGPQVLQQRSHRATLALPLRVARLAEAEDLGVGEDRERELGDPESFSERDVQEHERPGCRRLLERLAGSGCDVALGEQLGEPRRLRCGDDARALAGRGDLAQEPIEPPGVARRARPAEPQGAAVRARADRAAVRRCALDRGPSDVLRGQRVGGEAVGPELLTPLLGLRLVRIPLELELDRVLEHDARAIRREMVQQRCRRAERGRERVNTRDVAQLAERLDDPGVRRQLVMVGELLPAGLREAVRELRPAVERELARRQDEHAPGRLLRALRHRVERAERLDVVAEELDPDRGVRGSRVDVDDAAAPGERAGLVHLGDRLVAEREEPACGLLPLDPVTDPDRAGARGQVLGRDGVLHERAERRHDGQRPTAGDPGERLQPGVHCRDRGRPDLEWHRLVLRE